MKIRFEEEENPEVTAPENPMEKMIGGWRFDKKFIEQRKIFLWGPVEDKSAKDITDRLLYLEALDGNLRYHANDFISRKYRMHGHGGKYGEYFAKWWPKRQTLYFSAWRSNDTPAQRRWPRHQRRPGNYGRANAKSQRYGRKNPRR